MMTVDEIMTVDPATLGPDTSLEEAGALMLERRIRHIPIVDKDMSLLGLVTQRDLLGHQREEAAYCRRRYAEGSLYSCRRCRYAQRGHADAAAQDWFTSGNGGREACRHHYGQ